MVIKPGDIAKIKAMGYNLQLLAGTIEKYQKALQEIAALRTPDALVLDDIPAVLWDATGIAKEALKDG